MIFRLTISFIFVFIVAVSTKLHGDNICQKQITRIVNVTKKFNQPVELLTTEDCGTLFPSKCAVKKSGNKVTYKTVQEYKNETVDVCCDEFYEEDDVCKPCIPGKCKPKVENEPQMAPTSNKSTIGAGAVLLLILLGFTIFGVLYYRKKYQKEKDPELPTITYHPEPKPVVGPAVEPHREFQNPLFTRAPQLSEEEKQLEKLKVGTKQSFLNNTSSKNNEYAGLDEISPRPGSSSISSSDSGRPGNQSGFLNPNAEDPCTKPLLEPSDKTSEN